MCTGAVSAGVAVDEHVRAIGDRALIADEPALPRVAVLAAHRARHVGHRLARIGHVLVVGIGTLPACGASQPALPVRLQVQRRRRLRERPVRERAPHVGAGLEHVRRRGGHVRRVVLEVRVEERLHHVAPELQRGVAREVQRPERARLVVDAAVPPRAEHEVAEVAVGVLRLERAVRRDRAVHVLLIPLRRDDHRRHGQRLLREDLIERLTLPVRVVRGVLADLRPERELIEAVRLRVVADRAGAAQHLVVIGARRAARACPRRAPRSGRRCSRGSSCGTRRCGTSRRPATRRPWGT